MGIYSEFSLCLLNSAFSNPECGSAWLDCIAEDAEYLLTHTKFYEECDVESSGNDDALNKASDNTCFEHRRCENLQLADGDDPFPGYDKVGDCTCPTTQHTAPSSSKNGSFRPSQEHIGREILQETRFMRQTGESFKSNTKRVCRIMRAKNGKKRRRCDKAIIPRRFGYTEAHRIAIGRTDDIDEVHKDLI